MQNQKNIHAQHPDTTITFLFEHQDNRLLIHAQTPTILYSAKFQSNPYIPFQSIQKAFQQHNFHIIHQNSEVLKLKAMGIVEVGFVSKDKLTLEELKDAVHTLTQKLDTQIQKNHQLSLLTNNQQTQIQQLSLQLTQLKTQFDKLVTQTIPNCLTYQTQFFRHSEIICKAREELNIKKFFQNKTIKSTNLLYRATENDFCIKKFHEKCDGIANTLTVIWNEYDKKIGGFTPLKWSSSQSEQWPTDNSRQSFIFSLTNNDKFLLQQPGKAINNYQGYGPRFGTGADLYIHDRANFNGSSCTVICNAYQNSKYTASDKASWERFSGNPQAHGSCSFKIKEWEVWVIEWV